MGFGIRMYVLLPHLSEQSIVANVHQKGQITKYIILALFFSFFLAWFVGGYIHAKRRLKKGLPLLAYHRVILSPPSPQSPIPHSLILHCPHAPPPKPFLSLTQSNSSSYPTPNANATAKSHRTTSPSTRSRSHTTPIAR
jgi:hypothetical protein